MKHQVKLSVATVSLAFSIFGACASTDLTKATVPFRAGDLETAAAEISQIDGSGSTDGVWIQMEKGSILKAAGKFSESQEALNQCQAQMDELLKSAGEESVNVGGLSGAGAVMTDDRQCNYVGALYEAQLVCVLQMLNGMASSRLSEGQAAVSAFRARVDEADTIKEKVRKYLAAKAEENKAEAEKSADKYNDNDKKSLQEAQNATRDDVLKTAYASWADSALSIGLFLANVVDRENGKQGEWDKYIDRFCQAAKEQNYKGGVYHALADNMRKSLENLKACPPLETTYVIYEAGLAPFKARDEDYLIRCKNEGFIEVPLPMLQKSGNMPGPLGVTAMGKVTPALDICSLELLKQNEFAMCYPDIKFRAMTGMVIKRTLQAAGAATAIAAQDRTAKIIGGLTFLAATVAAEVQDADLRSWDCIPSKYAVACVPTPADGKVSLQIGEGALKREIEVAKGMSNIVIVTAMNDNMFVHHSPIHSASETTAGASNAN